MFYNSPSLEIHLQTLAVMKFEVNKWTREFNTKREKKMGWGEKKSVFLYLCASQIRTKEQEKASQ